MIYTKQLTDKYFLETQLRIFKSFEISFSLHYQDGKLIGHEGVFLRIVALGVFFEFNMYDINHNKDDND